LGRSLVGTNQTGTTMSHQILLGDCRDRLKELPDNSIDSIVTDPPYELGFMGKSWDASGVAYDVRVWQECLRVLKPGGHLLSFGGSRTYHRMACAIEDAGFQIRDQIMWVYGSGFPKSHNVANAIDKKNGAPNRGHAISSGSQIHPTTGLKRPNGELLDKYKARTEEGEGWEGWGTALKPAHEPIVLARKPLDGTVANNVLKHGVGGINIDGSRVGTDDMLNVGSNNRTNALINFGMADAKEAQQQNPMGRFPANFVHDGSDEVMGLFPSVKANESAARFFYCAKASKKDRNEGLDGFSEVRSGGMSATIEGSMLTGSGNQRTTTNKNHHPTVKPTELMRYLCRLITPPNGTVLDPFTGSGSTGKAAVLEGFSFIGVEQSKEYIAIAEARIKSVYDSGA